MHCVLNTWSLNPIKEIHRRWQQERAEGVGEWGDGPGHPRQGASKSEIKKITFY